MKRFEFRLQRVLDLRRQQCEIERVMLQKLTTLQQKLIAARLAVVEETEGAAMHVKGASSIYGDDLRALALFERHSQRKLAGLEKQQRETGQQIAQQQARVREAERNVKLLENLKSKRLTEWSAQSNQELEELAADAYLARMMSGRRLSLFTE
jgi:hypothetical protein